MSIEKELENARVLVAKSDKVGLNIQLVTIVDMGIDPVHGGYFATFCDSDDENGEDSLSCLAMTIEEALKGAIAKAQSKLDKHVRIHFRYSDPFKEM